MIRLMLASLVTLATLATSAHAIDRHTVPVISKVKRNAAGRVTGCQLDCVLLETGRGAKARLSMHRRGAYPELKGQNTALARSVTSGEHPTFKPLWVSETIDKKGNSTPVALAVSFGKDGLEGSEDLQMEVLVASAHASAFVGPEGFNHVYAAPTAPMQEPEPEYFVKFPKGTTAKAAAAKPAVKKEPTAAAKAKAKKAAAEAAE